MDLKGKKILFWGGDFFLLNELIPHFLESCGEFVFVNKSEELLKLNIFSSEVVKLQMESLEDVFSYEKFIRENFEDIATFDGVIFGLSLGSLRPLGFNKPTITSKLMEVNCLTFVELIRLLDKLKLIKGGSSIVAYSSISSLMGLKTKLAYGISKSALNSAVLNLAAELSSKKIRVNAILKGALTSDLNHEHVRNMFNVGNDDSGNQDLGMSSPAELAQLTLFLLSDHVKTMTGSLIKLDGGYSLS
jgi:enoyl-[acyl-carrier-protein] reductase (NADH)